MATIISQASIKNHLIDKYNFKILALGSSSDENETFQKSSLVKKEFTQDENPRRREEDSKPDESKINAKDKLIESLMQKTDEMSSNFIKLQMKLESKEEEYSQEIIKIKEQSFNEGVQEGIKKATQDGVNSIANSVAQFSASVGTLENSAKEFESALEGIKAELIMAALDISKEVVGVELSENSNGIAKILGDELIKELQSASKITLRVNPKDHGAISEHVGSLDHVQILSDSAVNEGGVIAISDAGNIDSQISKRFERVKKAALSE
ncbi:MAG: flagellar assembly protein FliH [Campylobacterota bacterium]|nr:flagellar assembly protein FliH [Campylobacterota bacterium]